MSVLNDLISQIEDKALRERIASEVDRLAKQKKFGLVFEEHLPECAPLYDIPVKAGSLVALKTGKVNDVFTVIDIDNGLASCVKKEDKSQAEFPVEDLLCVAEFGEPIYPYLKPIDSVCNAPDSDIWHTLIEADNYHALQLLEYLYAGKVDCIYIDPPYNTGARDWKYNNDYVDNSDSYRHSKWLSMMQKRLRIAKKLLNPNDSVLIVTIDEKEYLHLGCLLEEMFPEARMQMISSCINVGGSSRQGQFSRSDEYLFFVQIGAAVPQKVELASEWLGAVKNTTKTKLRWHELRRQDVTGIRKNSPGCFYPIYVAEDGSHIVEVGEALPLNVEKESVPDKEGCKTIFPIRTDGTDGRWCMTPESLRRDLKKGYIKLGKFTDNGMAISHLTAGEKAKIENGDYPIVGYRDDGSVITDETSYVPKFIPTTQWRISSHNATEFGTNLLTKIFCDNRFTYPKSLYAVEDALRFFIVSKPNALVIDFFAGSGTTLHAVNLLNAEDGGNRRCILVTNNEVSDAEAKEMTAKGLKPGDEEWEKLGIARYVTWPRTVCSIEGHDVNGNPLKGNYIGSDIPMADGFKANAAYFKLGFLDKNAVALGRQFKEMLPTLWMKAGAIGNCPTISEKTPNMLILPENKLAVLVDEKKYMEFITELDKYPEIKTIFIVTNSDSGYRDMISGLEDKDTYQLYRDYLDNFRINSVRR